MTYDSVVVGAGVSGMASALLLAKHGRKVALVEKHSSVAPLLRRFQREGVWFDVGFHYAGGLGPDGTLLALLNYLGAKNLVAAPLASDGFDVFLHRGRELRIPSGLPNARAALLSAFPASARAVEAYFDLIERLLATTPLLSFSADTVGEAEELKSRVSLEEFLGQHGAGEDLQDLLGKYGFVLSGAQGEEIPLAFHALMLGSYFQGAGTFPSGADTVVNALTSALRRAGVACFFGSPVAQFRVDASQTLQGVLLEDGSELKCGEALCTVHPQLLPGLVPSSALRPAFRSRLRDLKNTSGMFAAYLDLDEVPERLRRRNCYSLEDRGIEGEGFVAIMGADPEATPRKGISALRTVEVPAGVREAYWLDRSAPLYLNYKRTELETTLQCMERALPEIKGHYRVLDSATPLTFERYTGTVGGAAYGICHTTDQLPLSARTSVRGLFLAGQSVHFPGLLGTLLSAFVVCGQVLPNDALWREAREAWRSAASS